MFTHQSRLMLKYSVQGDINMHAKGSKGSKLRTKAWNEMHSISCNSLTVVSIRSILKLSYELEIQYSHTGDAAWCSNICVWTITNISSHVTSMSLISICPVTDPLCIEQPTCFTAFWEEMTSSRLFIITQFQWWIFTVDLIQKQRVSHGR